MSYNKVILRGNVGQDPAIKHFDNGGSISSFSLATTRRGFTAKDGTVIPDRTEWHRIVVKGSLVKVVESFIKKGSQILVDGLLTYRSYDNKDGVKLTVAEIEAENIDLLGKPQESQQPSPQEPEPTGDLPF